MDEGRAARSAHGFAVTPQLRQFYAVSDADADIEELEYAALLAAARASLRLLDVDPTAARRRVVVAADVPGRRGVARWTIPHVEPGAVRVDGGHPGAGRRECAHRRGRGRGRRPRGRRQRGARGRPGQRGLAVRRRPGRGARARLVRDAGDRTRCSTCSEPVTASAARVRRCRATCTRSIRPPETSQPAARPRRQRGARQADAEQVGVARAGAQQQPDPSPPQGGHRPLVVRRRAARRAPRRSAPSGPGRPTAGSALERPHGRSARPTSSATTTPGAQASAATQARTPASSAGSSQRLRASPSGRGATGGRRGGARGTPAARR